MTADEFDTWFEEHTACFTGIHSWLAKVPEKERDTVIRMWRRALAYVDLDDAREATVKLFSGEAERPRSFDDHPSCVRRLADKRRCSRQLGRLRRRFVDGEEVFACRECLDDGRMIVWHQASMRAALAELRGEPVMDYCGVPVKAFGAPGTIASTVVACPCEAGAPHQRAKMVAYRAECMLRYPSSNQELIDFVERISRRPVHNEFTEFSQ